MTINEIVSVEYRVDGGGWTAAALNDLAVRPGPDTKIYSFTTPTLAGGKRKIEARAQNSAGNSSTVVSDTVTVAVAPVNDLFANKITISSLPYNHAVNTAIATEDDLTDPIPNSDNCENLGLKLGKHSVWYGYEATSNDEIFLDTIGTDYNTVLSVWTGNDSGGELTNYQLIACADGASGDPTELSFTPDADTTYYFMISEFNNTGVAAALGDDADVSGQKGGALVFRVYEAIEVDVRIESTVYGPYKLTAGQAISQFYDGVAGGPVQVVNTDGDKIFVSEHRNYQASFSETLGYPDDQLTTKYWFTRYAYNSNVKTWLLIMNPDPVQTAEVKVFIGNLSVPIAEYFILPGTAVTPFYDGVAGGPVQVVSTNGVKIFASEHRNYQTSFAETLGYPDDQLTTKYWFTRYAYNSNVKTWLLMVNPQ